MRELNPDLSPSDIINAGKLSLEQEAIVMAQKYKLDKLSINNISPELLDDIKLILIESNKGLMTKENINRFLLKKLI